MNPIDLCFSDALAATAQVTPASFPTFTRHLDPDWIEQALSATGTATLRRRRLPADRVVWLVVGMALLRDRPIADVVDHLDLALPAPGGTRTVAPSAVVKARARVGAAPLSWLYHRSAAEWAMTSAEADRWRGLSLWAVDGTTLRVPDSPENRVHFGGQAAGDRGVSGYPSLRLVTVMAHGVSGAVRAQRVRPQTLFTSMADAKRFPAGEIRDLYHERWEIELGYGEIKTDLLERLETIRSKSPEAVAQEMWGLLLAYNLIRLEMERIADEVGVSPRRISFLLPWSGRWGRERGADPGAHGAKRYIADEWGWAAITRSPGAIPRHLADMRDKIRRFVLSPRRPERRYPRAVKIKMSDYPRKRPQRSRAK